LGDPARGDGGSAALPLAPLQRLDAGSPAGAVPSRGSSNGSAPSSDLPLHTPAASIPSAADIAVRAGLAERGPDGALFSTAAPAASYVVQRQAEGGAEVDAPVQRIVMGGHRAAAAGPAHAAVLGGGAAGPAAGDGDAGGEAGGDDGGGDGGGGGNDAAADAKDLSAEAKKLYPFIRSALEADIRRQIEGKSRASRFRP
jgi:hypothetical protein